MRRCFRKVAVVETIDDAFAQATSSGWRFGFWSVEIFSTTFPICSDQFQQYVHFDTRPYNHILGEQKRN